MVKTVRSHWPWKYKGRSLNCPSCTMTDDQVNSPRDTLTHITECESYEDMRANRDIFSSDKDMVDYFREVIEYRQRNNED